MYILHNPQFHEYLVVGRHQVTERDPTPKIYRMRLFAPNPLVARSKFWYEHTDNTRERLFEF